MNTLTILILTEISMLGKYRFLPEETIYQTGTMEDSVSANVLLEIVGAFMAANSYLSLPSVFAILAKRFKILLILHPPPAVGRALRVRG